MTLKSVRRRRRVIFVEDGCPTETLRPQTKFLAKLPAEIIDNVAPFVHSERDLAALAVTSRRMHQILNRRLYQMNDRGPCRIWRKYTSRILNSTEGPEADIHELESQVCGGHALFWAARKNRPETVAAMQAMGIETNKFGVLQSAAACGLINIVTALLNDPSCSIDSQDMYFQLETSADTIIQNPDSALHVAVSSNQVAITRLLLDRGADVNLVSDYGSLDTALHRAADRLSTNMMSVLLSRGADMSIEDIFGQTALHTAAKRNRSSIANLLLDHGGSLDLVDADNYTAFDLAIESDAGDCVRILLKYGALGEGQSQQAFFVALSQGRFKAAHAILKHFPDMEFDRVDDQGIRIYALMVAVTSRPTNMDALRDLVGTLLSRGAAIDAIDANGCTALHHACILQRGVIASFLVEQGADFMKPDEHDNTPLRIAMEYYHGAIFDSNTIFVSQDLT